MRACVAVFNDPPECNHFKSNLFFYIHISLPFYHFATNDAIQRTEAYEYAQSLGSQPCSLPNFQVFSSNEFQNVNNVVDVRSH